MELIKITDLTDRLGLSSRSLRYYEQVGLIKSVRPECGKYRFFDNAAVERLKQIIILRKMQIPIKDILRIYESENMSVVVETFVSRIRDIDAEMGALAELKRITAEFLQTMLKNGITRISALPLLYEEMDNRLERMEEAGSGTYKELDAVSERLEKPAEPSIVSLPAMRVLSSYLKTDPQISDPDGFFRWLQAKGLPSGRPGAHERFDFQTAAGDGMLVRVAEDFINDGDYKDFAFPGGLFAAASVYLDEDIGKRLRSLVSVLDGNKYFETDSSRGENPPVSVLLENLISPDDRRELFSLLVPVKRRLYDPALFESPQEFAPGSVSLEEIKAQNPFLWEVNVPLADVTPIYHPHYRVLENGEAEYNGWISTRVLSTNVEVKLPFQVDIEFRVDDKSAKYGYGSGEGSLRIYHGADLNYVFGVNMGNNPDERLSEEAILFHQPVFRDAYHFPKLGKIDRGGWNHLTWIVGGKHLAAVINGEIRYCGIRFPYMSLDLSGGETRPILIGSDGQAMKYIRSIRVSQLLQTKRKMLPAGELAGAVRLSNNVLPALHRLVTDEYGENYWFNGCARFIMERLHEKDFDYCFFAGLTGDVFAQSYSLDHHRGPGVSSCRISEGDAGFMEGIFAKCGYTGTFVSCRDLQKNSDIYLRSLLSFIDKGVPVLSWGQGNRPEGVFVGYEEYGKTLLYITGNSAEPERMPFDRALISTFEGGGWFFAGQKTEQKELRDIYRDVILNLPKLLTDKSEHCVFGAEAFRAWASDLESGKMDKVMPEDFDPWYM